MNFDKLIDLRASAREFTDEKVSKDDIDKLVHAANRAPIASGEYDKSRLTVISDRDLIGEIVDEFRKKLDTDRDPLYGAGLFIIFSSSKDSTAKYEDAGCVIENIHLKATELGLGSCYIRGMVNSLGDEAAYIKKLGLDEGFYPVSGIVIGHVDQMPKAKGNALKTNFI